MGRRARRLAVGVVGFVLLTILTAAIVYAGRVAGIAVAYKAKMLCSGVFVMRLDSWHVLADIEIDDLSLLRHVSASIDPAARSVSASVLGIIRREAVYRDGLGCSLVYDGKMPPRLPEENEGIRSNAAGWPGREGDLVGSRPALDDTRRERLGAVLDRAFTEPDLRRPRRTRAVVIVHRGRVVAERYAPGIEPETPLMGWSMAKTVVNALTGVLVGEGRLLLDRPVPVPEWQTPGDPRGRITLDHLLRMSSGLRFDEDMTSPLADVTSMLLGVGDMAAFAANAELEAEPGTAWRYSSGTSNIIVRVLRRVLRDDREYLTFPRRALFDRIGMSSAVLETDAAGTFVGSSFMYATARDWARLGMLYLQDGVWAGERILPEGWVRYSRSAAPAAPPRLYGAHFWLDVPDEYRGPGPGLPDGIFHAAGHEGQFVTIVPARETVIVRLGRTRYPAAWDHAAFVREVLAALD